ncbi:MBL fold metallo-hydrolase [Ruicaihuangia caeni]|uniref:MBL fold metallo-hydrolase n=1 Tax=Ruicaihuangia caeni TaxID=3042517 RepID=UPI00338D83D7
MRIIKHEHACLVVEHEGRKLVIDPGSFTPPLEGIGDVDAIVITHEHADHWTPEQLSGILEGNPDAVIFGPAGVVKAAEGFAVHEVAEGDTAQAGTFSLRFFGKDHAVIHSSIPVIDNVGVLVNDTLYYGGDSYTQPGVEVEVLAAPVGAPWLKIGEVIDYVLAVKPKRVFGTHNAPLSPLGENMANARLTWAAEQVGGEFVPLMPGERIEVG